MDVRLRIESMLVVDAAEWRLISKALRGVLLETDKAEALKLQEKMMRARHDVLWQSLQEAQKTMKNIEKGKKSEGLEGREDE